MFKQSIILLVGAAGKPLVRLLFKSPAYSKTAVKSSNYVSFLLFLCTVLFSNVALSKYTAVSQQSAVTNQSHKTVANEILFIDSAITDQSILLNALQRDAELVLLPADEDGFAFIAKTMRERSEVDAVHIVSHGAAGQLRLGSASLTINTLQSYQTEINALRNALSGKADILLYGCNVSSGASGKAFISAFAAKTNADVAASSNLTGDAAQGGDWVLETQRGDVQTAIAFSEQSIAAYTGLLADPVITSTAIVDATEDAAYSYTITASDVDNDVLTYSAVSKPSWLTFTTNTLSGIPGDADVGVFPVTLRVSDGVVNVDQSFNVTVLNINDAPQITSTAVTSASEDTAYSYTLIASDVDGGDTLTYSAQTKPSWLSFNETSRVLSGTPGNADVGLHSVVLQVTDGEATVQQSFNITVLNTNDAPQITSTAVTAATENAAYSYTLTAIDADGDSLTYSAQTLPGWMSFNVTSHVLSGIPGSADVGVFPVTLRVSDGAVDVDQSFNITVVNVNDAPLITSIAVTTATENVKYSYKFTASDVDNDSLTYSAPVLPDWLGFNATNQVLSGKPGDTNVGMFPVVLRVSDGAVNVDQSFNITVINVNNAPVISGALANQAVNDNATISPFSTMIISDADSDNVTVTITLDDNTKGVLTGAGLSATGPSYTLASNTVAVAQAAIRALVFNPADNRVDVNLTESTRFTIGVNDGHQTTFDGTTTVNSTSINQEGIASILGAAIQGVNLTASVVDDDGIIGSEFSYQWLRGGAVIVGATASTYTLVHMDVDAFISVIVSYTDAGNTAESVASAQTAAVINVNDLPVGVPVISGLVLQNEVLTAMTSGISDADGLGTGGFSYQWLRNGEVIVGAIASTYTLGQLDVGTIFSVNVRYTDAGLAEESVTSAPTIAVVNVNDLPVGVPAISGSVVQGGLLAVDVSGITDIDGLGLFSYQWLRDGLIITGATAEVYTLIQADVNAFVSVVVSYTDAGLTVESVLSNTLGPVGNINDIGVVTIVGLAVEAELLKVGTITDADGTSSSLFAYQWFRDGAAIAGATGDSYFLAEGENLRSFITLRVTYTDDFGANETISSNVKGPVFPDVPNVIPPATVGPKNATGWFTPVDINPAAATATDGFEGELTPVSDSNGQFRPGVTIVTWSATDIAGNVGTATQEVHVIPLAEVSKIQRSAEGSSAAFKIVLNGDALQYPVTVPYSVSNSDLGTGSANSRDHNLVAASATIAEPGSPGELPEAVIAFNIADDGPGEGMESLIITMVDTPELVNAVLGSNTEHTVEIVEGNVPPLVSLEATQVQVDLSTGLVSVFAVVTDANNGDSFSYDWSVTDNAVFAIGSVVADGIFSFNSADLTPGFYTLRVAVNDGTETVNSELMLNVQAVLPALNTADSDGDGVNDETESYADKDSDGIADYLDAIQAGSVIQILPGISDKFIMQTEAGLKLSLGDVAYATDSGASLVEPGDITDYIDIVNLGLSDDLAVDEIDNVGGYFDFTVSGLSIAGQSVRVVVPQLAQLPRSSAYRKLTKTGWQNYVEDENNSVASAVGAEGYCPPPGHSDYIPGLTQGHWCLQLTIEDGGPNDSDGLANNSVTDPGGLGRILTDISVSSSGGGGAWHPLLPALSLFIMLFFRKLKYLPGR